MPPIGKMDIQKRSDSGLSIRIASIRVTLVAFAGGWALPVREAFASILAGRAKAAEPKNLLR